MWQYLHKFMYICSAFCHVGGKAGLDGALPASEIKWIGLTNEWVK